MIRSSRWVILTLLVLIGLGTYQLISKNQASDTFSVPLGLPPIVWPEDNPYSKAKAELGKLLFFDKRLSSDGTVSCASCHSYTEAYGDPLSLSVGIHGKVGKRHAPTIINVAYNTFQFWDGRASSLEAQVLGPISNLNEMTAQPNQAIAYRECAERVRAIKEYQPLFYKAFGNSECSILDISDAIATFERTIVSGDSPYDRYINGDKEAMTPQQINGLKLFEEKKCGHCHSGENFTNNGFANIGVGMDEENPDLGRYEITRTEMNWGVFKVPTLRECALSGPYMHDGSLKTLEEVIDYYDKGGIPNKNLHRLMVPLHLTAEEKADLVAFLKALNGTGWQDSLPTLNKSR